MNPTKVNIELAPWTMFVITHKEHIFVYIQALDGIITFKHIGEDNKIDFRECSKLDKVLLLQVLN